MLTRRKTLFRWYRAMTTTAATTTATTNPPKMNAQMPLPMTAMLFPAPCCISIFPVPFLLSSALFDDGIDISASIIISHLMTECERKREREHGTRARFCYCYFIILLCFCASFFSRHPSSFIWFVAIHPPFLYAIQCTYLASIFGKVFVFGACAHVVGTFNSNVRIANGTPSHFSLDSPFVSDEIHSTVKTEGLFFHKLLYLEVFV